MTGGQWPRGHTTRPGSARTPTDHRIRDRAARGDPSAASRDLAEFISATRHARRQRALALTLILLSAPVLLTAAGGWLLTNYVAPSLGRVNAGTAGPPAGGPMNMLRPRIDVRAGLTRRHQALLHVDHIIGDNLDTLVVVHRGQPAARPGAQPAPGLLGADTRLRDGQDQRAAVAADRSFNVLDLADQLGYLRPGAGNRPLRSVRRAPEYH
jgi:hypothetical protein